MQEIKIKAVVELQAVVINLPFLHGRSIENPEIKIVGTVHPYGRVTGQGYPMHITKIELPRELRTAIFDYVNSEVEKLSVREEGLTS